jgi:hypothetical protein
MFSVSVAFGMPRATNPLPQHTQQACVMPQHTFMPASLAGGSPTFPPYLTLLPPPLPSADAVVTLLLLLLFPPAVQEAC